MNWKQSLDKYLTSGPPEDGFDTFCEEVILRVSEESYESNPDWWDCESTGILKRLFYWNMPLDLCAKVIERYFLLYIKGK